MDANNVAVLMEVERINDGLAERNRAQESRIAELEAELKGRKEMQELELKVCRTALALANSRNAVLELEESWEGLPQQLFNFLLTCQFFFIPAT